MNIGSQVVLFITIISVQFYVIDVSTYIPVPLSAVALSLLTQRSLVAGSELNVTCEIAGQTSGLTGSYMTSISAVSIPGSITTTSLEDRGVSVLNINPLRTSHPTMYTCRGFYFSPAGNRTLDYEDSLTIKVQSKLFYLYSLMSEQT